MKPSFPNARTNLYENMLTIGGLDPGNDFIGVYEIYRHPFCDQLELLGYKSDNDYSIILSQMNECQDVGDFLCDEKTQLAEIAAFGLILFERIIQAIKANANHIAVFYMHEALAECLAFVLEDSGIRRRARASAKAAADARHDKPGNSRDKREAIRTLWASGKFSSRDLCVEQESAALNMSISTARKALRNTPDPT